MAPFLLIQRVLCAEINKPVHLLICPEVVLLINGLPRDLKELLQKVWKGEMPYDQVILQSCFTKKFATINTLLVDMVPVRNRNSLERYCNLVGLYWKTKISRAWNIFTGTRGAQKLVKIFLLCIQHQSEFVNSFSFFITILTESKSEGKEVQKSHKEQ